MWVLLHKLLHDHDAWVALLLDAEEELELGGIKDNVLLLLSQF